MFRSVVYHRSSVIGEVEIHPKNSNLGTWTREIRISYISHPPSDRCSPLAVLHTISTSGVCFRMESKSSADESLLFSVYSACLRENKTAVASIGEEELHLVAMPSRRNIPRHSCFWGYIIARGLYNSCLVMLNHRCLGIVFDLDETLLVANTMRSLEDKIDGLQRMISSEMDPQRANGMLAVIKRYQDDKSILKQYVDGDQVVENGKVFKTQSEAVPPLLGSHQLLTRPIIRLHEKNIILTRVNPSIRDTSVLVRLRPAWEDLRNYLTANGRKWFEVYVCTMAEREYALEMWRLLDPECNLINSSELLDRIVCVKSGLRKSLFSVFQDGVCHPKMSLVIDDRLEVWDEKDQSRVLVVPPFAPHFGPQAEANNDIPVLCAARNLACNVRGSFFKDFDEVLSPRMSEIFYEDEVECPSAPDVGNYLIPKDHTCTLIGNKNPLGFDGMADAEVERRLKGANRIGQSIPPIADNFDTRAAVPPGPTVITPTAPAVSLTTTQFPNTVVLASFAIPDVDPVTPREGVLTQRERRLRRDRQRKDKEIAEEGDHEEEPFALLGFGEKLKDTKGNPLLKWNATGKSVKVSTDLPFWGGKLTRHASAVTSVLYGKRNLRESLDIETDRLPDICAQAAARSTVLHHHMGRSLLASIDHAERLQDKFDDFKRDAYDINNPDYLKSLMIHIKDASNKTLDILRERGGLTEDHQNVSFADLFPDVAEMIEEEEEKKRAKEAETAQTAEEELVEVVEGGNTASDHATPSGSLFTEGETSSAATSTSGSRRSNDSEESSAKSTSASSEERSPKRHRSSSFFFC